MSPSTVFGQEKRAFASEIKFLLPPEHAARVQEWARENLARDPNASGQSGDTYEVSSLYFDTPELSIYHRVGPFRHSKFRIRRYGGSFFFVERKLKVSGQVAKQRTALTPEESHHLDNLPTSARWFVDKTRRRRLRPVCQINYLRTARVAMTPQGPIRVTLDRALQAAPVTGPHFDPRAPSHALTDSVVLELKFRREMPVLFRELAQRFTLSAQTFSKYRTAVESLGLLAGAPGAAVATEINRPVACLSS